MKIHLLYRFNKNNALCGAEEIRHPGKMDMHATDISQVTCEECQEIYEKKKAEIMTIRHWRD